jgi:hypothetical protein
MPGSSLNNVVVGGVGLDNNLPGFHPAAGPTGYLAQELEGALATSEIRKIKASICIDYPGQRYLRKI